MIISKAIYRVERVVMPMPDFSLRKVDSFAANTIPRADKVDNIVVPFKLRFPYQPAWPTEHHALEFFPNELRDLLAHYPRQQLVTDELFHDRAYGRAVEADKIRRWWVRWLRERGIAKDVAEEHVEGELRRREERFTKTKLLAEDRTFRQLVERLNVLESFAKSRELRWQVQNEWAENRIFLIDRGQIEDERNWDWHKGNLFVKSSTGAVNRLPVFGRPLERVLGEIHHQKVLAITRHINEWRFDYNYIELPNGGMTKVKGIAGFTKEHVDALVARPVQEERTKSFSMWHRTRFEILSPNGVPIEAPLSQGLLPERMEAKKQEPLLLQRTEAHQDFHQSGRMVILPNESMVKAPELGMPIEAVTPKIYWPERTQATDQTQQWHRSHAFVTMENGGIGRLPEVGYSLEKVGGDVGVKDTRKLTQYFDHSYKRSDHGDTPNGGFAPLMKSGDGVEVVAGERASQMAHQRFRNHEQWLWTGKSHAVTSQGPTSVTQLDLTPGVIKEHAEEARIARENLSEFHSKLRLSEAEKDETIHKTGESPTVISIENKQELERSTSQEHVERVKKSAELVVVDGVPRPSHEGLSEHQTSKKLETLGDSKKGQAIKAFQATIERDAESMMGRLQGHVVPSEQLPKAIQGKNK